MKKNILILALILIAGFLLLNAIFNWFHWSKAERVSNEEMNPKNDTIRIETKVTKDSTIYVKYEPNLGELAANNVTRNYYTYVSDTLAPALKIATSKIAELQQVKASLEGTVKAQKQEIDNQKIKTVYFKDKYFTAQTKTDTLGNATLSYNYDAQIDVVTENKQQFLKKDLQTVYITSPDKNLKINGVEHFKKETFVKPKNVGIGFQGGYGLNADGKLTPYVGIGASYNLIKF